MLIERAEGMAERLHGATRSARADQPSAPVPPAPERAAGSVRAHRPRPVHASPTVATEAPVEAAFVKALRRAR